MADPVVARTPELHEDLWFRAKTTQAQFAALAARLDHARLLEELAGHRRYSQIERGKTANPTVIKQLLLNGWNTEYLLNASASTFADDALRNALQWAFPQAYYSVFAVTLAYFKTVGYTEESHSAVMRKVGSDMILNRYPASMSFTATGAKPIEFQRLNPTRLPSDAALDPRDAGGVDWVLQRFLNATRRIDLDERKRDTVLKTARGRRRRAFRNQDWRRVAEAVGPTTCIHLLYRKRIKANYRDIETYICQHLAPDQLFVDLACVVAALNAVHEGLIRKAVGQSKYAAFVGSATTVQHAPARARLQLLERLDA